jgi:hypothetical protein
VVPGRGRQPLRRVPPGRWADHGRLDDRGWWASSWRFTCCDHPSACTMRR